jgi:hypothetical protein
MLINMINGMRRMRFSRRVVDFLIIFFIEFPFQGDMKARILSLFTRHHLDDFSARSTSTRTMIVRASFLEVLLPGRIPHPSMLPAAMGTIRHAKFLIQAQLGPSSGVTLEYSSLDNQQGHMIA